MRNNGDQKPYKNGAVPKSHTSRKIKFYKTMRKLIKFTFIFLVGLTIFNSCKPYEVTYFEKKAQKIDKVAIVATYISPMQQDWTLSISFFNERINSISSEINLLFKDYANIYRDSIASIVKENCNCEVIYGRELHNKPGFKLLKEGFDFPKALKTKNENFPYIIQATDDINPFMSIKNADAFLDTLSENQIKSTIKSICQGLEVNYLIVSYNFLYSVPGNLYVRGRIALNNFIFLYDKDGDCLAWGKSKNNPGIPINGGKIEQYPEEMNKFPILISPVVENIIHNYPNY